MESNQYKPWFDWHIHRQNCQEPKCHTQRVRGDDGYMRRNKCRPIQSGSPVCCQIVVYNMISCDESFEVSTPCNPYKRQCIIWRSLRLRDNPSNLRYDTDAIAIGGIQHDRDCRGSQSWGWRMVRGGGNSCGSKKWGKLCGMAEWVECEN